MAPNFENNPLAEEVIELSESDLIEEPSEDEYSLESLVEQNKNLLKRRNLRGGEDLPERNRIEGGENTDENTDENIVTLEEGDYEIVDDLLEPNKETIEQYQKLMRSGGAVHVENEVSPIGENIEAWGEIGPVRGMGHVYSVYDQKERPNMDKCEDTVVFNRQAKMIALGDGMGGVGSGDLAAKAFKKGMEDLDWDDFSGKTEEEIKNLVFEKLQKVVGVVKNSGGKITCSLVKFYKDADGKNKAVIVNVGDSGIVRLGTNGKFEELGEADSAWKMIQDNFGSLQESPARWAKVLNSMGNKANEDYRKDCEQNGDTVDESKLFKLIDLEELTAYLEKVGNQVFKDKPDSKFDFHAVMNFIVSDKSIDDEKRNDILKLFKNINRQTTSHFGVISTDHIKIIDVNEGDQFILGSDGLFDNMDNNQLQEVMGSCDFSSPEGQAELAKYIKSTHGNGVNKKAYHKPDDVSYVAVKFIG